MIVPPCRHRQASPPLVVVAAEPPTCAICRTGQPTRLVRAGNYGERARVCDGCARVCDGCAADRPIEMLIEEPA